MERLVIEWSLDNRKVGAQRQSCEKENCLLRLDSRLSLEERVLQNLVSWTIVAVFVCTGSAYLPHRAGVVAVDAIPVKWLDVMMASIIQLDLSQIRILLSHLGLDR